MAQQQLLPPTPADETAALMLLMAVAKSNLASGEVRNHLDGNRAASDGRHRIPRLHNAVRRHFLHRLAVVAVHQAHLLPAHLVGDNDNLTTHEAHTFFRTSFSLGGLWIY